MLDDLRDWFGTLYVAQSSFDELLELRSSSEFASRQDTGFLGYHEGKHFRSELTAEEAGAQKARIDAALEDIQRCCEIVPVDDSQSIEGGWKSALAENSLLLDPILAARERCGGGRMVYIGDSSYDRDAARAANVPFIAACYGYCDLSEDDFEADALIHEMHALIPAIVAL